MGLGALNAVSLAAARKKAEGCRNLLTGGIDPINARKTVHTKTQLDAAKAQTFRQCAEAYIEAHKVGWRNAKHAWQWENTLSRFAYPVFGDIPVQDVDVALVIKILEPIWKTKTETASRIRGRIEVILDWATAREYRQGENPARWRGHLENLLPKRSKVQKVEHQPALPYDQVGDFMTALKEQEGAAALALTFTILTAGRTAEVIGATWGEMDLQKAIWTVPAHRIKAGREHRVPLSEAALRILKELKKQHDLIGAKAGNFIFNGQRHGRPLSNTAMLMLLRRMGRQDITVHGFRSSFRDWAAEQTNFAREVAESALAHISGDKVELAYRRGDLFDKRRKLMDAWARYCATPSAKTDGKVVKLARK
jgi:integrase